MPEQSHSKTFPCQLAPDDQVTFTRDRDRWVVFGVECDPEGNCTTAVNLSDEQAKALADFIYQTLNA